MTEALSRLLEWTKERVGQKNAMQQRFSWLLEHYAPEITFPVIKVAGTNGKGSVSAMLSACLHASGKKVGLFTSPHLVSVTERFRINEREISEEELEKAAAAIEKEVRLLVQKRGAPYTPSFFEVLILIALRLFSQRDIDVAIFEAGIGGANDAVSLLPDFLALITSIGLDHQQQLGHSLGEIASDKAGIARNGQLLVNRSISPVLKKIIQQNAASAGVRYQESKPGSTTMDDHRMIISCQGKNFAISPALQGLFQQQNVNLVVSALQVLIESGQLHSCDGIVGLEKVSWPGRYEKMGAAPTWLIDAAHNESGLQALADSLDKEYERGDRILVYGNSEEKEHPKLVRWLPELANVVYLVDDFYKAFPRQKLAGLIGEKMTVIQENGLEKTLSLLRAQYPDRVIVITGSIFMIGQARKWIVAYGLDE